MWLAAAVPFGVSSPAPAGDRHISTKHMTASGIDRSEEIGAPERGMNEPGPLSRFIRYLCLPKVLGDEK